MNILTNYLNILNSLDLNKVCYIKQSGSKIIFQQDGSSVESTGIYFDIKRPVFISPRMMKHNYEVIQKLLYYEPDNLISLSPTKSGFYCQVFNKIGGLIYAQYINLFNTNWFQTKFLQKKYPELVLKLKTID